MCVFSTRHIMYSILVKFRCPYLIRTVLTTEHDLCAFVKEKLSVN